MKDFVTIELAKKLKEKGFREKCLTYYDVEDNVGLLYNTQCSDGILPCQYTDLLASHNANEVTLPDDSENCVDAPTISQVLKWLRESWKVVVTPEYLFTEYNDWNFNIRIIGRYGECESDEMYSSYEEAALAGIEYVIDNLI